MPICKNKFTVSGTSRKFLHNVPINWQLKLCDICGQRSGLPTSVAGSLHGYCRPLVKHMCSCPWHPSVAGFRWVASSTSATAWTSMQYQQNHGDGTPDAGRVTAWMSCLLYAAVLLQGCHMYSVNWAVVLQCRLGRDFLLPAAATAWHAACSSWWYQPRRETRKQTMDI